MRVTLNRINDDIGVSLRTLQSMCAKGQVPSAAKVGGSWTVNVDKIRRWIAKLEEETCHTFLSEGQHIGGASELPATSYGKAYEQAIRPKRNASSINGRRN